MELKAVTAAEKLLFIKHSRSMTGDCGELQEAFAPYGLKSLKENLTNVKSCPY